jgi:hypothetical protein
MTEEVSSNFPTPEYVHYLVSELGYDPDAALAALIRSHVWRNPIPDRRRNGALPVADAQAAGAFSNGALAQPAHPYNPASPTRRTTRGGGFTKQQTLDALARMRTDDNTKFAVMEIVYRRRSTLRVSDEYGVPVETLYVYASRLRKRIRRASSGRAKIPIQSIFNDLQECEAAKC